MVKVQIDLSDDENYVLDLYKVKNRLKSKEKALKHILRQIKSERK